MPLFLIMRRNNQRSGLMILLHSNQPAAYARRPEFKNILLNTHKFVCNIMCEFIGGDGYGDKLTN